MKAIQDWEYAEEIKPGEWETIDIQLDSEDMAVMEAQEWANKTGHRCVVETSIRYEENNAVQDRGEAPGNPEPIIINPSE